MCGVRSIERYDDVAGKLGERVTTGCRTSEPPTYEESVTVGTEHPPHQTVVWVTVEQVQHPRTVWTYLLSEDDPDSACSAAIHNPSIPTVRLCRSYIELCT